MYPNIYDLTITICSQTNRLSVKGFNFIPDIYLLKLVQYGMDYKLEYDMVIGLDIDDTITRNPEFFSFLSL